MSSQDTISNFLTTLRNGQLAKKNSICIYYSKICKNILIILKQDGFILNFQILNSKKKTIIIYLRYYNDIPVINKILRISKPRLRIYKSNKNLKKEYKKYNLFVLSTSKGVMSNINAIKFGIGGEVLCYLE